METIQDKSVNYKRYMQAKKWTLAIKEAETLIQSFPEEPHGYVWLFQAHGQQDDGEAVFILADQAVERFPNIQWVWAARASLAHQKQEWDLASKKWQACIERFPELIDAYVGGARTYICNRKITKAQELINRGAMLSPAHLSILSVQAEIYEYRREYHKANTTWAMIRKTFPENPIGHREGVKILHRLQDHLGALNVMINWIKSDNGKLCIDYDYATAVQALIRGFFDLDLENPATFETFRVLIAQPLASENHSAVSELAKAVQSLSMKWNPKYQPVIDYIKDKFQSEIGIKGSTTRMFALSIGIKDLTMADEEIAELISGCNQDIFCRYFSGHPLHISNVMSLKDYISRKNEAELFSNLSEDGLKNLHLFATAENEVHKPPFSNIENRANVPQAFKRRIAPLLNKNRLRIAVCVSGQLRGYKAAFNTWKKLGLEEHDTHYFVHCWQNIGRKLPDLTNAERSFSGAFLPAFKDAFETYGPAHIHAEYSALFTFFKTSDIADISSVAHLYNTKNVILEDDTTAAFSDYSNPMKMFYKIQKSWGMMQDSRLEFDLVMRIRPDKTLVTKSPVDWTALHGICSSTPTILTDRPFVLNCSTRLYVGDQLAISTPDVMAIYSEIFSNKKNNYGQDRKKSDFSDPHTKLAFTLYEAGLTTSQNSCFSLGPLLDAERQETAAILALIKKDAETRQQTVLDRIFISALEADLRTQVPES